MEKPQALVLLLAITILASTAHAQFDWAEGLDG